MIGIDKIIEDAERFDLTGDDILRITDGKTKVMAYEDLESVSSINEILSPYGAVIILYQTSKSYGHWISLIKHNERHLEFFDSYGYGVDEELNFSNEYHMRQHNGQIVPHLSHLLDQSDYKVIQSGVKLQKVASDVNTCGRYCALRVRLREYDLKSFIALLTKNKAYDADEWTTALTILV